MGSRAAAVRRLLGVLAVGVGALAPVVTAAPALAVDADACVFDATMSTTPAMSLLPVAFPTGSVYTMNSLALVCGGTRLLGTGSFSSVGTVVSGGAQNNLAGTITLTTGAGTCSGSINGLIFEHEFVFDLSTGCGSFTAEGFIQPLLPSTSPPPSATLWNLVGGIEGATGTDCSWVAGTGCTYVAGGTADTVIAVSPSAPTVSGNTSIGTWSQTPIPGTGTSVWQATVFQAVGAWVTISAPSNTSGAAIAN